MYRQRFNHPSAPRPFLRRQKFFDPSLFVQQPSQPVEEEVAFVPVHKFADFAISPELKANIVMRKYELPTPIQDQAIPHILQGRDVVGLANTGTGKTAAYLIPLIDKVFKRHGSRVLIVTPTRELAVQIDQELRDFARGMRIFSALCIGGVGIYPQIQALRRNPQFVIGTPGRLKDLNEQGKVSFESFDTIVLDEVDRMLDMGFVNEIRRIIAVLPQNRHSLFFSATLPLTVLSIMRGFLHDPVQISVKSQDTMKSVHQDVVHTMGKAKIEVLHELLTQKGFDKVLVFGRTKHGMEKLSRDLTTRGFRVAAIHGNKNQNQRQKALNMFKQNMIQVLLATDVASRGLDINDVTHVINYELPESYEDYIHRIGRTGRASKTGVALTFVD